MNNHIVEDFLTASKLYDRHYFLNSCHLDDRVYRLFGVACCREAWGQLADERSRKAVEVAELYADGLVDEEELIRARENAWKVYLDVDIDYLRFDDFIYVGARAAHAVSSYNIQAWSTDIWAIQEIDLRQQGLILASMCPIAFSDNWITPTTKSLAQTIYDKKDFSIMPILADALQDVDCTEEILTYLRGIGPFYKGNYIIDKLIGKRQ